MTTEEFKFGWIPQEPDIRDRRFSLVPPTAVFPPAGDVGLNVPVFDQGQLGSCTANASSTAFMHELNLEGYPEITPARLFVYYNARLMMNSVNYDSGARIRDAVKSLNKYGTCLEVTWPYHIGNFKTKPTAPVYVEAAKPQNKTVQYQAVNRSLNDFKAAIVQRSPIIIGFTVYQSFMGNWADTMPMPNQRESVLGGHCVLIIGYDDARQCFLVRNSWGTNWKMGGNFWMPYNVILNQNLSSDFWIILSTGKA